MPHHHTPTAAAHSTARHLRIAASTHSRFSRPPTWACAAGAARTRSRATASATRTRSTSRVTPARSGRAGPPGPSRRVVEVRVTVAGDRPKVLPGAATQTAFTRLASNSRSTMSRNLGSTSARSSSQPPSVGASIYRPIFLTCSRAFSCVVRRPRPAPLAVNDSGLRICAPTGNAASSGKPPWLSRSVSACRRSPVTVERASKRRPRSGPHRPPRENHPSQLAATGQPLAHAPRSVAGGVACDEAGARTADGRPAVAPGRALGAGVEAQAGDDHVGVPGVGVDRDPVACAGAAV